LLPSARAARSRAVSRRRATGWPGGDSPRAPDAATTPPTTRRNIRTDKAEYPTDKRPACPHDCESRHLLLNATTQGPRATRSPAPASAERPRRRTESSALRAATQRCAFAAERGRYECCARRAEKQLKYAT